MKSVLNLLKRPYWVVSPLTQAKSFKTNPVIGSRLLNLPGLHVIRIVLAQASTRLRWLFLAPMMPRSLPQQYQENGFVLIENLLSSKEVSVIRREIAAHEGPVRHMTQGDTITQRFLLDQQSLRNSSQLKVVSNSRRLKSWLNYTGAKIAAPLLYMQRIRNGISAGDSDPQKNIHSDTFHPTMKAWLFLEDVTPDMGPVLYVPGSNRLGLKRLGWEYQASVNASSLNDVYSKKGSLRLRPADSVTMGLSAPKAITAKAGTLLIANTNGFHGRGPALPGTSRLKLWAFSRHNPFNPLPGVRFPLAGQIKHTAMHQFWRWADKRAGFGNRKSSRHLIPKETMLDGIGETGINDPKSNSSE